MARQRRILVVEDDAKTAALARMYLEREGFLVDVAADGPSGLARTHEWRPDLLVLDLMLPGLDGLSLCAALRRVSDVPVLMLTARSTVDDRIAGLRAGADDYLPKPFSPRELVLRVRAILKRAGGDAPGVDRLEAGDLSVDVAGRLATLDGRPLPLTAQELRLLEVFMRAPGRVFTRDELVARVMGDDFEGQERTIDVHVKNLRRKVERRRDQPERIVTVFGVGYRFVG